MSTAAPPLEIEATLARLSAYRNVRGVMIVSREAKEARETSAQAQVQGQGQGQGAQPSAGIVQSTGSVFEGESGRKYAAVVEGVAASVSVAVDDCDEGVGLA